MVLFLRAGHIFQTLERAQLVHLSVFTGVESLRSLESSSSSTKDEIRETFDTAVVGPARAPSKPGCGVSVGVVSTSMVQKG